ncbi:Rne/Rng family ribonuclease [Bacillus rubiinfantis]|uniref:Rne/Rng family ribonuclease n=1 Tax=Bacillus rubiinfantis TaxID=1499680 RepID=UPI0005A8A15F|nr:Rne/Rng family ribonuclease [Bacillus rubiinfantis]
MERLVINCSSREKRFAFLRDGKIEKLVIDRPEHHSLVGNIYIGTVTKVLPGMNAAFVDIGTEKQAYLHRNQLPSYAAAADRQKNINSFVHQGEKLLVQVEKDATGVKGPKVTGLIEIQGTYLIYLPKGHYLAISKKISNESTRDQLRNWGNQCKMEEEGLIFRTSSENASETDISTELEKLRNKFRQLMQQVASHKKPGLVVQRDHFSGLVTEIVAKMNDGEVVVDDIGLKKQLDHLNEKVKISYYHSKENIFSFYLVEHEIEKALKRVVWLENGAYLIFDETEALTIIDVNTGKFSGKTDYQDTVLQTNLLAAKEIVHQLKLRDIGGMVLIDFIDMKRGQDKEKILAAVKQELMNDEKRTKVIGFTELDILQLTRKRTKVSLAEATQVKCPVCNGTGRVLSPETVAFRLERELLEHRYGDFEAALIETTKAVQAALLGPNGTYKEVLEELLHFKLYFSVTTLEEHTYSIVQFGNEAEISIKAADNGIDT